MIYLQRTRFVGEINVTSSSGSLPSGCDLKGVDDAVEARGQPDNHQAQASEPGSLNDFSTDISHGPWCRRYWNAIGAKGLLESTTKAFDSPKTYADQRQ